jgi:putative transposase
VARARIRDLEEEVKILRKAAAAVEAVVRPKGALPPGRGVPRGGRANRAGLPCPGGISAGGYNAWAGRAPSPRAMRQVWLTGLIGTIHQASCGTYGALRMRHSRR